MKPSATSKVRRGKASVVPYHHGDLRSALLIQASRALREKGVEGLNLRELAEAEGVSVGAIYRHFESRSALLTALVDEGFAALAVKMLEARASAKGRNAKLRGRAELIATGRAYVAFAQGEHRSLFRLMFSVDRNAARRKAALCDQSPLDAFGHLHAAAATLAGGADRIDDADLVTLWAGVHGLAMLMLDGALGPDPHRAERALDRMLQVLADAISSPSASRKSAIRAAIE